MRNGLKNGNPDFRAEKDTKGHFGTRRARLIETSTKHAAKLVFDVFLKQSAILKSIRNFPVAGKCPNDQIALIRTYKKRSNHVEK